jgi:hypothetical protein
MSDEAQAPAGEDMENRIREAYDRLPDIAKRRKTSRIIRLSAFLLYVLILVLGIWSAIGIVYDNVVERSPELATHLQDNIGAILPTLQKQAEITAGSLIPKLQAELGRAQRIAQGKFVNELTGPNGAAAKMKIRLESDLENLVQDRLKRHNESQIAQLEAAFPDELRCESTDSEKVCAQKKERSKLMLELLLTSHQRWAQSELGSTYAGHFHEMEQIATTMKGFSGAIGDSKDVSNNAPEDILTLWIEFAGEAMAGSNDMFEAPPKGKR